MPEDDALLQLGTATVGLELHAPICLSRSDLRRHLYVIGKTGTGKSTLLYNLMRADLDGGRGFALLDPHGDLAVAIADATPAWRISHGVIYLDPADLAHPVGFNPLNNIAVDQRPLVAAHIVAAFQHIWGGSWGPRLEYILTNSLRLLLDAPGTTLLGLPRLLADARYRASLLAHARDPVVRGFWQDEFAQYNERYAMEAIAPIQNKVGTLLSPPAKRVAGFSLVDSSGPEPDERGNAIRWPGWTKHRHMPARGSGHRSPLRCPAADLGPLHATAPERRRQDRPISDAVAIVTTD